MTPATDAAREEKAREIAWKLVIGEKVGGGDGQTYVGRTPTVREVEAALLAFADTEAASQPHDAGREADRRTVNTILARLLEELQPNCPDMAERIRAGNEACTEILALTRPPAQAGAEIAAITAEMRRFMPNACGDWADKIDAAMLAGKARKVAFYHEPGHDIRPGETLPDRDRRIYQQGRHDALNDEPEAFI